MLRLYDSYDLKIGLVSAAFSIRLRARRENSSISLEE